MKFTDLRDALRTHLKAQIAEGATTGMAIATAANTRQAHVSNFLNGKRGLSFETADRLLQIAGLDTEDLIADQLLKPRRPFQPATLGAFITVPIVDAKAAMLPRPQQRHVRGSMLISRDVLQGRSEDDRRSSWTRFVAVNRGNAECVIVDRHRCQASSKGKFAVVRNGSVQIGRLLQGEREVVFCPDDPSEEACSGDRVIGRVIQIQRNEPFQ